MGNPPDLHKSKMAAEYLERPISNDLKFDFGVMGHQESVEIYYYTTDKLY